MKNKIPRAKWEKYCGCLSFWNDLHELNDHWNSHRLWFLIISIQVKVFAERLQFVLSFEVFLEAIETLCSVITMFTPEALLIRAYPFTMIVHGALRFIRSSTYANVLRRSFGGVQLLYTVRYSLLTIERHIYCKWILGVQIIADG